MTTHHDPDPTPAHGTPRPITKTTGLYDRLAMQTNRRNDLVAQRLVLDILIANMDKAIATTEQLLMDMAPD